MDYGEKMEWDAHFKGLVLSAFTYGYMSTQIIGGRLAELYGVKKVVIYTTRLKGGPQVA